MTEIRPAMVLECSVCHWRPLPHLTMGVVNAHIQTEHGDPPDPETVISYGPNPQAHLDLVAVCTCGATMTLVVTTRTAKITFGLGRVQEPEIVDRFICFACHNTGTVYRKVEGA